MTYDSVNKSDSCAWCLLLLLLFCGVAFACSETNKQTKKQTQQQLKVITTDVTHKDCLVTYVCNACILCCKKAGVCCDTSTKL
jgi:hypothetical protein